MDSNFEYRMQDLEDRCENLQRSIYIIVGILICLASWYFTQPEQVSEKEVKAESSFDVIRNANLDAKLFYL